MYVSERGQYNPQQLNVNEEVYAHPSDMPVDGGGLAWGLGQFDNRQSHGQGQVRRMDGRMGNEAGMGGGYEGSGDGSGWYGADHNHHSRQGHQGTRGFEYVQVLFIMMCMLTILGCSWDDVEAYVNYASAAERQRLAQAQAAHAQMQAQAGMHGMP